MKSIGTSSRSKVAVRLLSPVLAGLATAVAMPQLAHAGGYTLNYMTNYSGCDAGCGASSLSYTDDQVDQLGSALNGYGHTLLLPS